MNIFNGEYCKNNLNRLVLICFLFFQSGVCFSDDSINLIILPDQFECHQLGFEVKLNNNNTLGAIGRYECESDRPTYGSTNDNVQNTFSRIVFPWRYSKNGAFKDSFFLQSLVGLENSKFKSTLGSEVEVTFIDLALHLGYQWFWNNGFNVSAMAGLAFLFENSVNKNIVENESSDVVDFLNENSESNIHAGIGVIIGWSF